MTVLEKHLSIASLSKAPKFNYEKASKPKESELCLRNHGHVKNSKSIEVKNNEKTGKSLLVRISVTEPTTEPETPKTDKRISEDEEENNNRTLISLGKKNGEEKGDSHE